MLLRALGVTRTRGSPFAGEALYPLSYEGTSVVERVTGFEPAKPQLGRWAVCH
jgi:hypothetical protein